MSDRTRHLSKRALLRKCLPRVHEDMTAVYARDLRKWLIVAPVIGLATGLFITGLVVIILGKLWPPVLNYYLLHHWAIVPGVLLGFVVTGLIMQFLTPDPDEHSTEEIIRSYHEHEGMIDMRSFVPKLLAAIATVGFGGSAALEGPSIYGWAALGSWLWTKLRSLRLNDSDRRIMLIFGAPAGMSAVCFAPHSRGSCSRWRCLTATIWRMKRWCHRSSPRLCRSLRSVLFSAQRLYSILPALVRSPGMMFTGAHYWD